VVPAANAASPTPVAAEKGMVVSAQHLATRIGVDILKRGGSAIDAAVAVGYAMAVVYPAAGNLGGGGFMTIRFADGRKTFLDFREKAPAKSSRNMYLDAKGNLTKDSLVGWRAAGVPGSVRGLEFAHKKFGHKSWGELVEPAAKLAGEGFPVSYSLSQSLKGENTTKLLEQFPEFQRRVDWYQKHRPDLTQNIASMKKVGNRDRQLLAVVDEKRLRSLLRFSSSIECSSSHVGRCRIAVSNY